MFICFMCPCSCIQLCPQDRRPVTVRGFNEAAFIWHFLCNRHLVDVACTLLFRTLQYQSHSHPRMRSTTAANLRDGHRAQSMHLVVLLCAPSMYTSSPCSAPCLRTGICGNCGSTTVRCGGTTTVPAAVKALQSSGSTNPEQPNEVWDLTAKSPGAAIV
jgi:hypothetical protein